MHSLSAIIISQTGLTVTGMHSYARPNRVCVSRGSDSDVVEFCDHEAMEG
jgi:hypothetical protein